MKNPIETTCTERLSDYFIHLPFDEIPIEVIEKAREHLVDTVGVAINGTAHREGQPVYQIVREAGGIEESTVWGKGIKAPSHQAALVNGTFTHCIEMDDTHRATYLHSGAFVVPPAIAVAEKVGATGSELLKAIVAGYETSIRIALSVSPEHRSRGFHTTGTVGVFGAAMAAGLLLKLDKKQMVHAMGLAGTQAAGLFQFLYDGCMAKRIHPGKSGQSGIYAALLAQKQFTGSQDILEGSFGFGAVMSDRFDANTVINQLGNHWHILEMGIKPYSACRFCHAPIDAALELRERQHNDIKKISSIKILGSKQLFDQTGNQYPATTMGAQLSTPFMVALATLKGKTMPVDVDKGLRDKSVLELAAKTEVTIGEYLAPTSREVVVTMTMESGREETTRVELPLGEPEKPLSKELLRNKFSDLTTPVLGETGNAKLYTTLSNILDVEDCRKLSKLFSP